MRTIVGALLCILAAPGFAAQSLTALLDRVPAPPPSAAQAAGWVDADGNLSFSGLVRIQAELDAEMAAATAAANQAAQQGSGSDIDYNRMASDPAYAQQVQQRLQSMTPEQQMAMAMQQQAAAMGQAQQLAQDPPEVRAAFQAYQQVMTRPVLPGAGEHYSVTEQRTADQIRARFDARQAELSARLGDCNECTTEASARAEAQNRAIWKQKLALADEELGEWAKFFAGAKAARQPLVAEAQRHMAATGFGAKARSATMRQSIIAYQELMLGRIAELTRLSGEAATRAAGLARSARESGAQ